MQAPHHTGQKKITNWLKEGKTVQERQTRLPISKVIKKEERGIKPLLKANMVRKKAKMSS